MKLYDIKTVGNNFMMNNEHEILNTIQALKNDRFLKYYGILSYKQQEGLCLLSMEYGEATLSNILKAGKNYASEELASVMESVVESFKILQDNGICNRDVKPQNIILVKNAATIMYDYKVSDFGIGYVFPENSKSTSISSNTIIGLTQGFAAPELSKIETMFEKSGMQTKKCIEYDPFAADVFSLGMVFLQMIKYKNIKD